MLGEDFHSVESERGLCLRGEVTSSCQAGPAVTPGYETDVEDEENRK